MEASSFSFVCVALRGQKQSERVTSPPFFSSLESFETFCLSLRTTSLPNPVSIASSQPLHSPKMKNKTGSVSPSRSNVRGSNAVEIGDPILLVGLFSWHSISVEFSEDVEFGEVSKVEFRDRQEERW